MRQILLYPDHEDDSWVTEVPSLPGCISQGITREEAIKNTRDAIETWISGAEDVGMDIPSTNFMHSCNKGTARLS